MLLLLLFLVVAEILLLVSLGRTIGALSVLALLLGTGAVGVLILRRRMPLAIRSIAAGLLPRRAGFRSALRGEGLLLVGAFLLVMPGVITDAVGAVCLVIGTLTWRRPPQREANEDIIDVPFHVHDEDP